MVPTKRFWLFAALGIPVAMIGSWVGIPYLFIVYDLILVVTAFASTRLAPPPALRIRRDHDHVLSVRTENQIVLKVENDGNEPIQAILRDEPPGLFASSNREFKINLDAGRETVLRYQVTPPTRGSAKFRGTFLRISCPLGLVTRQEFLDTEERVRVYPNLLALKEFDLLKQQGRLRDLGIRHSRQRGLGMEFESLREYTQGDDYRKLDWKASARRGKLVVRQFEQERNQAVIIVIDVGRHMMAEANGVPKLDHVLDALLMLTNAAAMAGDMVGLLAYADNVRRYIPPRKGRAQIGAIIDAIHDMEAEPVESDPINAFSYLASRWKRRSLVVTFTDYEDVDRAEELCAAFAPMARRHVSLLSRVLDPRMKAIASQRITSVSEMYQVAAGTMLMEDRRNAARVLKSRGIHTLDSDPENLASDLVNYYFKVKELSLL